MSKGELNCLLWALIFGLLGIGFGFANGGAAKDMVNGFCIGATTAVVIYFLGCLLDGVT